MTTLFYHGNGYDNVNVFGLARHNSSAMLLLLVIAVVVDYCCCCKQVQEVCYCQCIRRYGTVSI